MRFALQLHHRPIPPPHEDVLPPPLALDNDELGLASHSAPSTLSSSHSSSPSPSFFSLPLWKRRHTPQSSAQSPPLHLGHHEPSTMIRPFDSLKPIIDKALPPTPSQSEESQHFGLSPSLPRSDAPHSATSTTFPSSPSLVSLYAAHDSPKPGVSSGSPPGAPAAAYALAHASLGVGLPHGIHPTSMSASASDGHLHQDTPESPVIPAVRRVRSTNRLASAPHPDSRLHIRGPRRSLAIDDPRFDARVTGSSLESLPAEATPPRPGITRRPSFWQRKRNDSHKDRTLAPPQTTIASTSSPQLTVLPTLPPVSPFDIDIRLHASPSSPQPDSFSSSPRLARRESEKKTPTTSPSLNSAEWPRAKANRRPSTAGGILERPRSRSLYHDGPGPPPKDHLPSRTLPPPVIVPLPEPDEPPSRPQALSNTPLLRRLSVSLFSFANSSPTAASPIGERTAANSPLSQSPVPPSTPRNSLSKTSLPPPKPEEGETPESYLVRLTEAISKADVASALAHSGDEFHTQALRAYIARFEFADDSLDVAVRRLLMDVGLPRETQQIDRVMEAFAVRYYQDHKDLFTSEDHPYILAFSLIMLHTDAFNRSNKRKMTKMDYVRNTRLPGVPPEVLDCFYDNIVFAPFIFIEDPLERTSASEASRFLPGHIVSSSNPSSASSVGNTLSIIGKSNKVDPYYLITRNQLGPLRVNVEAFVPNEDPFSIHGTKDAFQEEDLRMAFAHPSIVEVPSEARRMPSSLLALSMSGDFPSPYSPSHPPTSAATGPAEDVVLKVIYIGLLRRRDIVLEGGKRVTSRKWRECSVILTGSQLLFFRDSAWAARLKEQAASGASELHMPYSTLLRPDEVMGVRDVVAVYDRSYTQSENTFTLAMGDGRNILFCAPDEADMNQWISCINYASAFRSTEIRMRPLGLSGKDVQLMGVAAAKSHLRELDASRAKTTVNSPRVRNWDNRHSGEYAAQLTESPPSSPMLSASASAGLARPANGRNIAVTFEVPTAPSIDGAQQFKAAFDEVKADLAAGRIPNPDECATRPRALSLESAIRPLALLSDEVGNKASSRASIVRSKIKILEQRIDAAQAELESDLRLVRNIAVLTPFQRATRERLQVATEGAAKRIRQQRLGLAKHRCQREVLENDLLAEARDWNRNKTLALKIARDTLQQRRRDPPTVPRVALSLHIDGSVPVPSPSALSAGPSSHRRSQSSAGGSFHTALDYEWTLSSAASSAVEDTLHAESPLATPLTEENPMRTDSSSSLSVSNSSTTQPSRSRSNLSLDATRRHSEQIKRRDSERSNGHEHASSNGHERFTTAQEIPPEEAEEWNKTRAAKRVSLVRVPSDLRISRAHVRSPTLRNVRSGGSGSPPRLLPSGEDVAAFIC